MVNRYKPKPPATYPSAWVTAARQALLLYKANTGGELGQALWVSADRGATVSAAQARMERMRAFRDGLALHPFEVPELGEAIASGLTLTFRRQFFPGLGGYGCGWNVQMRWKEKELDLKGVVK